MKQKLWSWGDDFTIKDESGLDRFFVDGRAFSLGDKLSFQDMAGNELAFIRQKLLAWGPHLRDLPRRPPLRRHQTKNLDPSSATTSP